jgi:hypothetical protein
MPYLRFDPVSPQTLAFREFCGHHGRPDCSFQPNPEGGTLPAVTRYALGITLAVTSALLAPAAANAQVRPYNQVSCGTNLSTVKVTAGTTYALEDGCSYSGSGVVLHVNANDVTITNYGSGSLPVIHHKDNYGSDIAVSGTGDEVENVRLTGTGYPGDGNNDYELGIDVTGSSGTFRDVQLNNSGKPDSLYAGIFLESSATKNTVEDVAVNNIDAFNPSNLGSGAFGVLIWGSSNTIENSTFDNQEIFSTVYGYDGSGVELYGSASHNVIKDNTGNNDNSFSELGTDTPSKAPTGNEYLDNTYTGSATKGEGFVTTRGSGDTQNGPVFDTIMTGNNVTDAETTSYDWKQGNGTLLALEDNTFNYPGGTALYTDGGCVNDGGNIVKAGSVQGGCIPS